MNLSTLQKDFRTALNHLYQIDEIDALFMIVVNSVMGYNSANFILKKNDNLTNEQLVCFETICTKLKTGEPIQHILGETVFYGLRFKVNRSVLVPRPETEELVDWMVNDAKLHENAKVLDIGTGSGCIAISIKANWKLAKVTAVDIATDSLEIAEENAAFNNTQIDFLKEDILAPSVNLTQQLFDVIVSNPPYIKEDEKPAMHENVLNFEPHRALFVSNEKPLIFYEAIADFANKNLKSGGLLYFEINEYLGLETVEMIRSKSFINIELRKDMQGKDRMIKATKC